MAIPCRRFGTTYRSPINPLNAELNPSCHLLAFLGAHHILHISRIRVKMEEIGCAGTSILDYRSTLRKIPEDHKYESHHCH